MLVFGMTQLVFNRHLYLHPSGVGVGDGVSFGLGAGVGVGKELHCVSIVTILSRSPQGFGS